MLQPHQVLQRATWQAACSEGAVGTESWPGLLPMLLLLLPLLLLLLLCFGLGSPAGQEPSQDKPQQLPCDEAVAAEQLPEKRLHAGDALPKG